MRKFKNVETGAICEPQSKFMESVLTESKGYVCLAAEKAAKARPEKPKEE